MSENEPRNLLESLDDGSISEEAFSKILVSLSAGKTRRVRALWPTSQQPLKLYRARAVNDVSIIGTSVANLSYPPDGVARLGRANPPGRAIFYASAARPVVFAELKGSVTVGKLIAASEWRCSSELILQEIGLENGLNDTSTEYEQAMHTIFTAKGAKYYQYSSAIAGHLMSSAEIAGIVYPCVEAGTQSENVAIKTEFVDNLLQPINVVLYEVVAVSGNYSYEVKEIDFATVEGDKLEWKGRRRNWVLRKAGGTTNFVSNGWDWEAVDDEGNFLDPE